MDIFHPKSRFAPLADSRIELNSNNWKGYSNLENQRYFTAYKIYQALVSLKHQLWKKSTRISFVKSWILILHLEFAPNPQIRSHFSRWNPYKSDEWSVRSCDPKSLNLFLPLPLQLTLNPNTWPMKRMCKHHLPILNSWLPPELLGSWWVLWD